MKNKFFIPLGIWIVCLLIQPACGGTTASGDLPKYPGAVELKAGESAIGSTLAQNMKQDAALRQAVGTGGKTEQRGFKLPGDTTWEQVKSFYDRELKAGGWESGLAVWLAALSISTPSWARLTKATTYFRRPFGQRTNKP